MIIQSNVVVSTFITRNCMPIKATISRGYCIHKVDFTAQYTSIPKSYTIGILGPLVLVRWVNSKANVDTNYSPNNPWHLKLRECRIRSSGFTKLFLSMLSKTEVPNLFLNGSVLVGQQDRIHCWNEREVILHIRCCYREFTATVTS